MIHEMLARVAKYMMCNRQVKAVKPFRKPFKVTPRPKSKGKRVLKQQRQKSSKKVGWTKYLQGGGRKPAMGLSWWSRK